MSTVERDDRKARRLNRPPRMDGPTAPLPIARATAANGHGAVNGGVNGNSHAALPPDAAQATGPLRARKGFRTVLRNPHFLRLWLAQLISQTIMNAANYGMIVLIATQSGSVTATGGAIVAFSLPAALFGAPAGVLVDRFDKRMVLWVSNALRALATFGFVLTLFIDQHALVPVYLLSFFIALVGQFFAPAEGASIPLLVHEDELVNALALFNVTFTLSQAVGLIMLGPLIITTLPNFFLGHYFSHALVLTSVQSLFVIVGLLYLVCSVLVLTIPHSRLVNRVEQPHGRGLGEGERLRGIWAGIVECWHFVRRGRALLAAVLQLSLGGVVIAVIAEVAPRFVQVFFNQPPALAAIVFIPAGVGLVLGSFVIPHIMKSIRHTGWLIPVGIITLAFCTALLTAVHWLARMIHPTSWWLSWVYIGTMLLLTFLMGLSLDLVNIPAQTMMQEQSPDWIKGRVLALQLMVFNAATVPVVFLVGLAADYYGLPLAMNVLALFILVAGLASARYGVPAARTAVRRRAATAPRRALRTDPLLRRDALQNGAHRRDSGHGPTAPRDDSPSRPLQSTSVDPFN
ncbi:MAG TPA: MFS transporter [Ktedonobacterales bacterium]